MFNKTYFKVSAYTNIEGNAGSSKRSYTKIYLWSVWIEREEGEVE